MRKIKGRQEGRNGKELGQEAGLIDLVQGGGDAILTLPSACPHHSHMAQLHLLWFPDHVSHFLHSGTPCSVLNSLEICFLLSAFVVVSVWNLHFLPRRLFPGSTTILTVFHQCGLRENVSRSKWCRSWSGRNIPIFSCHSYQTVGHRQTVLEGSYLKA